LSRTPHSGSTSSVPNGSTEVLVVVPCGKSKSWDREPDRGPVSAKEAYTGTPFRLSRQDAERFGDAWVVLSAKYGFTPPDSMIPEPYDVSFKLPSTSPIAFDQLRQQIREQQLGRYPVIVGSSWSRRLTPLSPRTLADPSPQERRRSMGCSRFFSGGRKT
jgi:hypothetical protein